MATTGDSTDSANRQPAVRHAHAVLKQRSKLAYAAPQLVLLSPPNEPHGATDRVLTLREAREARRLTIEELAQRSRISPSTIYRIEYGKTHPRPHVMHALSTVLGVAPREIAEFRGRIAPLVSGS
jgi:ribosome-binding protein aMBF1 (putative translation factor)